jgi:hypothetical protein
VVQIAFVHPFVQLGDLLLEEFLINIFQAAQRNVVGSQELVELIHVSHVLIFLESNVNDSRRDAFPNSIKELGFSDDYSELRVEVNAVGNLPGCFVLRSPENFSPKQNDCSFSVFFSPFIKDFLFVLLVKGSCKVDVLESNGFESRSHQLIGLLLELFDWALNSAHYRSSPSN